MTQEKEIEIRDLLEKVKVGLEVIKIRAKARPYLNEKGDKPIWITAKNRLDDIDDVLVLIGQPEPNYLTCPKCSKTFPLFMEIEFGGHVASCKYEKPKDQPSSEFTVKCRAMADVVLESTAKLTEDKLAELLESDWNGIGFILRIYGTILEGRLAAKEALVACDRLDTSEASRSELLEALKNLLEVDMYRDEFHDDGRTAIANAKKRKD